MVLFHCCFSHLKNKPIDLFFGVYLNCWEWVETWCDCGTWQRLANICENTWMRPQSSVHLLFCILLTRRVKLCCRIKLVRQSLKIRFDQVFSSCRPFFWSGFLIVSPIFQFWSGFFILSPIFWWSVPIGHWPGYLSLCFDQVFKKMSPICPPLFFVPHFRDEERDERWSGFAFWCKILISIL